MGAVVQRVEYTAEGWGVGGLWWSGGRLVHHELPAPRPADARFPPRGARDAPTGTLSPPESHVGGDFVPELVRRLRAYFGGELATFDDVEVELDWCTPFQRAVALALRRIPYGEVVTYGELAALGGYPNAHRAAGSFCARNRFPLVLPCHRVVAAGSVGGYGSLGVEYKRRLLRLEGVAV